MSSFDSSISAPPLTSARAPLWIGLVVLLGALAAILLDKPIIVLALVALVPATVVVIYRPYLLIPLVLFALYTNAVVVAVRFHDVPSMAAMFVPAVLLIPLAHALWSHRTRGGPRLIITGSLPLIVVFILVQLLGVLVARYRDIALSAVQTSITEGLLLYFLVTNVVRDRQRLTQATWALLLAGCLMGGLSLVQQFTGTFHEDYGGFAQVTGRNAVTEVAAAGGIRQPRLCGPIGEQNRYAQIMLMLVPLGIFQFWTQQTLRWRWLALLATGLSGIGCALTYSRGAAVGFLLMLVLMAMLRQISLRHLLLLLGLMSLLVLASPQYRHRLASLLGVADVLSHGKTAQIELDGAIRGRATVMLAAVRVTADYPLIGVGPAMFNFYSREYGIEGGLRALEGTREAHSLYLELSAEHGLVGLVCFLAIVFVSLRNLRRAQRMWQLRDPQLASLATAYFLAIASYLCTGLFLHFSYARYFWLMLALADAASFVSRSEAEPAPVSTIPQAQPAPGRLRVEVATC